ncbi:MAG: pyruvate carboxylase subunit B [Anaerolineaceae bacterium]|nr:pyruvate carboxylase subunit B [Anaerolineaceae bacterium]
MNKILFTETALRDAHQSLFATRMRFEDMEPILALMDQAGYHSLECWGGATFDVCLKFLNEDPWERLNKIRKTVKKTKLQMLLRGQNLLGYSNYPDDIVEMFVAKSIEHGIDIIRLFDALNDVRNLEASFKAIKKYGGHAQGAICYTTGPIYDIPYFVKLAKIMESMGADSLAIKDMAGILTPKNAFDLVAEIKRESNLPLSLHTHSTSGTAAMTLLKSVEAGCDVIDTAISPLSSGTSQAPTETMVTVLNEFGYETGLDLAILNQIAKHFKHIKTIYENNKMLKSKVYEVDPLILETQIPGGMYSNLLEQLRQSDLEDKINEVLQEVKVVRSEVGYPPLVTPMSQIVAAQAVANILAGSRYSVIPNEMRDYLKGLYGQAPGEISEKIRSYVLLDEEVLKVRPADMMKPRYEEARKELGNLARSQEDVLSYVIFPESTKTYLKNLAEIDFVHGV